MKANELRLGNIMLDRLNRICKVEEILKYEFKAPAIQGGITSLPNKPIPLTEEWLLKFGFNKFKGNNTDCFLDDFETSCNMELFFWKGTQIKNIKYVHQLQNLYFALTGEELTLNK